MKTKFLDNNGLLYVWKKVKDTFVKKEEFEEVKGNIPKNVSDLLDAESYAKTSAIPTKVSNLTDAELYAKKTEIPDNISAFSGIDAYAKVSSIPKKISEFEDHTEYVKKEELTEEVLTLVGNKNALTFSVEEELPASGDNSIIYLVANEKGEHDAYDEYIWVDDKFEKIGTTAVDLSGYVKASEITTITNEEIDALFV